MCLLVLAAPKGLYGRNRNGVFDGWNLLAELDENGVAKATYVWGLDLSQGLDGAGGVGGLLTRVDHGAGEAHHYFYDGNGNVGQLVDGATGMLGAAYEYDPYGSIVSSTGVYEDVNPFRFSTKFFDGESGLYYYGLRHYSSEQGRWISRDPIGEKGGFNLYSFVANSPVDYVDPYGDEKNWKAYIRDREKISPAVAWLRNLLGLYDDAPSGDPIVDMINDRARRANAVKNVGEGIAVAGEVLASFHDGADFAIVISEWSDGQFNCSQLAVLLPVIGSGHLKIYDKFGKLIKKIDAEELRKFASAGSITYGKNEMVKLRKHSQHMRETARKLGVEIPKSPSKPATQQAMRSFIEKVVEEGEMKVGKYMTIDNALWHKLDDAIVVRKPDGEFLTFLDWSKGDVANMWKSAE